MGAYIAVTNDNWFHKQKSNGLNCCVFWRKNQHFKALVEGNRFYFYVKGESSIREIVGYAHFERFETNTIQEAWEKHGKTLGSDTYEEFYKAVTSIYKDEGEMKLGCIVLSSPVWAKNGVLLSSAGIPYAKGTVAGKTIDDAEDKLLAKMINGDKL